jgi:hypothetical protein
MTRAFAFAVHQEKPVRTEFDIASVCRSKDRQTAEIYILYSQLQQLRARMKRYAVVFEESAQAEVRESYDWSTHVGLRQLRTAFSEQLSVVPKAFPLAPEDEDLRGNSADGSRSLSHTVYDQGPQGPRVMHNLPSRAVVTRTVKCTIRQHL